MQLTYCSTEVLAIAKTEVRNLYIIYILYKHEFSEDSTKHFLLVKVN